MELLTEADELLTKIEAVEVRCREGAVEVTNCREALKAAKKLYDEAVVEMRGLARVRKEEHPLFDAAAKTPEGKARQPSLKQEVTQTFRKMGILAESADASGSDSDDDPSTNGEESAIRNRELAATIRQMKRDEPKWSQEGIRIQLGVPRSVVREALKGK